MKRFDKFLIGGLILAMVAIIAVTSPVGPLGAQTTSPGSPNQALLRMRTLSDGVQQGGANVLQSGPVYTISAAVASATDAKVVTAGTLPTYIGGIWVEKMATSTGTWTLEYGTGTNCGTGKTTVLTTAMAASQIPAVGEYKIGALIPLGKDTCLVTEGANTSIRAMYN